jgi:hypothetical protein
MAEESKMADNGGFSRSQTLFQPKLLNVVFSGEAKNDFKFSIIFLYFLYIRDWLFGFIRGFYIITTFMSFCSYLDQGLNTICIFLFAIEHW